MNIPSPAKTSHLERFNLGHVFLFLRLPSFLLISMRILGSIRETDDLFQFCLEFDVGFLGFEQLLNIFFLRVCDSGQSEPGVL
jgi:hypothetical protein